MSASSLSGDYDLVQEYTYKLQNQEAGDVDQKHEYIIRIRVSNQGDKGEHWGGRGRGAGASRSGSMEGPGGG